jgi:C-22 sterol desaturase
VDYRKSLNPLFTRQALGVYLTTQEKVYNKYLERFVELSKEAPRPFMHDFREINCAVSLKAFCGEYISNDQISLISDNYYRITAALELVNFPIILPFTKPWYGKRMADQTMDIFADCSKRARVDVQSGSQPTCILDSWLKMQYDAQKNVGENGKVTVRSFSDKEISETLFTFLFASQDASSSATTWLFQILADRPDIMAKVREEQYRVRNGDLSVPLTPDLVDQMEYTTRVVRECLRYRPPVTMVPYVAKKRFQITEDYAIPKNAMVIPTLYPALHDPEVYENPDHFDPDRWLPGSTASNAHKNWLVFGAGPHVCIGQQYVFMNLASMMGKAALLYDWKHTVTEKSEKIRVFATIFPDDDCILQFRHRTPQEIASGAK